MACYTTWRLDNVLPALILGMAHLCLLATLPCWHEDVLPLSGSALRSCILLSFISSLAIGPLGLYGYQMGVSFILWEGEGLGAQALRSPQPQGCLCFPPPTC